MTAAAANHLGLACTIVLGSDPPEEASGNVVLDQLLGPEIVWAGPLEYYDLEAAIEAEAQRLRASGRRPYAMPLGGASTIGQLGYVRAALELREQLPHTTLIATADGTGGTHAGLVAGWGDHDAVLGVDVGHPARPGRGGAARSGGGRRPGRTGRPQAARAASITARSATATARRPAAAAKPSTSRARLEGLLLDPVYSGKAMAGLIAAVRGGRVPAEGTIVFVATGGLPALLTPRYTDWITKWP